jgi:hypothetical protein
MAMDRRANFVDWLRIFCFFQHYAVTRKPFFFCGLSPEQLTS